MSYMWGQQWVTQCALWVSSVFDTRFQSHPVILYDLDLREPWLSASKLQCIFSSSFIHLSIHFWKCAKRQTLPLAWSLVLICCGFQCRPPLKVNPFSQNDTTTDNFNLFVDAQQGHCSFYWQLCKFYLLTFLTFYIVNVLIFLFFIWSTQLLVHVASLFCHIHSKQIN